MLTAVFLYVILGVTDTRAPKGFAPLAIGLWEEYLVYAIALGVADDVLEAARLQAPELLESDSSLYWYGGIGDRRIEFLFVGTSRTATLSFSVLPIRAKFSGNTTSRAFWLTASWIRRSAPSCSPERPMSCSGSAILSCFLCTPMPSAATLRPCSPKARVRYGGTG